MNIYIRFDYRKKAKGNLLLKREKRFILSFKERQKTAQQHSSSIFEIPLFPPGFWQTGRGFLQYNIISGSQKAKKATGQEKQQ